VLVQLNPEKEDKRWLMWGILALGFVIAYIHRVAPSVVADQLMETFAIRDGAVLGSLAAMYSYTYVLAQIPSGLLADSLGPRATVSASMVIAALGSLLFSFAPTLALAFVGRFLIGLGVSFVYVSILKLQSVWFFPNEFAFLTGMTILVGNAGAVLATTPMALMVDFYGWRFPFLIIGLASLLVAAACWFVVRDYPASQQTSVNAVPMSERISVSLRQLRLVLANRRSWPPFIINACVYGTTITFSGIWGVPYLMQVYNFSRTQSANLMLVIAVGMMVGSPAVGYLSDRIGLRKLPYSLFVFLFLLSWAVLVFWNNARPPEGVLFPLYFLLGFFGSTVLLGFAVAKEENLPQSAGMAVATVNIGVFLGISILQPLMGYLLDLRWDGVVIEGIKIFPQNAYYLAFRFCFYAIVVAFLATLLVRETCIDLKREK
jgi:predicted MFS family arabinose efflux permease